MNNISPNISNNISPLRRGNFVFGLKSQRSFLSVPKWVVSKSVVFFLVAFGVCTLVWGYPMEMRYAIISIASVILFFYGSVTACNNWASKNERTFIKYIFLTGFIVRILWVLYCYFFFYPDYYGNTYGDTADVDWYIPFAKKITDWLSGDSQYTISQIIEYNDSAIDDTGYPMWLAIEFLLLGDISDVFFPFLIKSVVGAYCAVCIYHIAVRHFNLGTARMAAIFVALNPNMIYWCGSMFKEAEMVFLCCLCVDLVDRTFTSGSKLTFKGLLPGILVGFALFFFRAPLAIVIFMAMGAHIVMASGRVMSFGKKIIAGVMVVIALFVGLGDQMRTQTQRLMETAQSDSQKKNMEWRSERKDGANAFARYAGAAVFAPLIFTIPFPTFNNAEDKQILQLQLSGGSYIKNIFSFFVIWVMIIMLMSGEWRRHVFILAYTLGYLMTLVLSEFAQSGRFHMPVWPMLMLFAAYGIQIAKKNGRMRRWYTIVLVLEVVACLAWNWYKLAGRGLI